MKLLAAIFILLIAFAGIASSMNSRQIAEEKIFIKGNWSGSYSIEKGPSVHPVQFRFNEKGRLYITDGPADWADAATGDYTMQNDTITAVYRYDQGLQTPMKLKAYLHRETNQIIGTWRGHRGNGSFVLENMQAGKNISSVKKYRSLNETDNWLNSVVMVVK